MYAIRSYYAPIDVVVVNLYPFFKEVQNDISFEEKVEFIDIGGPTMLRSASKNFKDVTVISDVNDYERVMNEINESGDVSVITSYSIHYTKLYD